MPNVSISHSLQSFGIFMIAVVVLLLPARLEASVRIKDIARVEGVRDNQLIGYGLVVGLDGTGDDSSAQFAIQSVVSMLDHMGVSVETDSIQVDNVAAVMVTATLPAFAKPGTRLDVTVSSIGSAESLLGGTLLMTPLIGADKQVYAVAQGAISLGVAAPGEKKHLTVGRIPDGALIEKEVPMNILINGFIHFNLHQSDFTTVMRMARVINQKYPDSAQASDGSTVVVKVPPKAIEEQSVVAFLASIERLRIDPDSKSQIVINERTGTIVAGEHMRISTVAVAHGNLSVTIRKEIEPASSDQERGAQEYELMDERLLVVEEGVSIGEVARALNALGVTPKDAIVIFQAIKQAGAMQGDLKLI